MNDQPDNTEHQAVRNLLVQYAFGGLEPDAQARLEQVLEANPGLARETADLQRTLDLLPHLTQSTPPAHLRARVLAAAQQKIQATAPTPIRAARRSRNWPLFVSTSLAAAASFACAVLLVERADMQRSEQQQRTVATQAVEDRVHLQRKLELETKAAAMLQEPNVVLSFELDGMRASNAVGHVMLDLDAKRASIAISDLPAAPAGYSYHLWAVLDTKSVPCGRFVPAENGWILTQFMIPVDSYSSPIQKLILTVEPDQDQTAPKSSPVMSS